MARITILGGTGFTGSRLVREAASRGHEVTSYSRHDPTDPVLRVNYKIASLIETAVRDEAVSRVDVVISALAPRAEMESHYEAVHSSLIDLAAERHIRFGVIGGFGSLRLAPGHPRFVHAGTPPHDLGNEPRIVHRVLEALTESAPEQLDWFFVSPAAEYGREWDREALGGFRTSGEVALFDGNGRSALSAADFAVAVIDEVEDPSQHRAQWSVAY
ncbi:NAD(P)H-binding protein [Nocardia sp. R7R-8]|uniref:NAD(P)H-binding protein n=1 Tax=Nocardia sp. R7R-8 TaxID=3459304 RepID=UPI00403DF71F